MIAAVGTVYPAYATSKAFMSKDEESMSRWLQYWIVFAALSMLMPIVDPIGSMMPLYFEAKVAFFLWLTVDKFQGATYLTQKYLVPFLTTHQGFIDEKIDFVVAKAKTLKAEDLRAAVEFVQTKAKNAPAAAAAAKAAVEKTGKTFAKAADQMDKPEEPEIVEKEEDKKAQ